jgi:CBS-domain-containing membrane protein
MADVTTTQRVAQAMVTAPSTHGTATTVAQLRRYFADDHVHLALIVAPDGRLVSTVERADLTTTLPGATLARSVGTLAGRTVGPDDPVERAAAILARQRRRRLAVVDGAGRLLGLLCLKRSRTGFCSDADVRARAADARAAGRPARAADQHGCTGEP